VRSLVVGKKFRTPETRPSKLAPMPASFRLEVSRDDMEEKRSEDMEGWAGSDVGALDIIVMRVSERNSCTYFRDEVSAPEASRAFWNESKSAREISESPERYQMMKSRSLSRLSLPLSVDLISSSNCALVMGFFAIMSSSSEKYSSNFRFLMAVNNDVRIVMCMSNVALRSCN